MAGACGPKLSCPCDIIPGSGALCGTGGGEGGIALAVCHLCTLPLNASKIVIANGMKKETLPFLSTALSSSSRAESLCQGESNRTITGRELVANSDSQVDGDYSLWRTENEWIVTAAESSPCGVPCPRRRELSQVHASARRRELATCFGLRGYRLRPARGMTAARRPRRAPPPLALGQEVCRFG
ncbi:hypothetical protein ACP70R_019019 [Stipagrostis hirtigluma subsp. patula]